MLLDCFHRCPNRRFKEGSHLLSATISDPCSRLRYFSMKNTPGQLELPSSDAIRNVLVHSRAKNNQTSIISCPEDLLRRLVEFLGDLFKTALLTVHRILQLIYEFIRR